MPARRADVAVRQAREAKPLSMFHTRLPFGRLNNSKFGQQIFGLLSPVGPSLWGPLILSQHPWSMGTSWLCGRCRSGEANHSVKRKPQRQLAADLGATCAC